AMLYDPKGVGGTGVVTVLGHGHPEWYNLPVDPHVPWGVRLWKQVVRPLGILAAFVVVLGTFTHYTKYGPKEPLDDRDELGRRREVEVPADERRTR
ncbi:MAG TPA: formate dehydrogenase N subunit beta transmembrane domain-containing protein, partial [Thermoanaerobaculia bacterium]